jgi:hypothetical protein
LPVYYESITPHIRFVDAPEFTLDLLFPHKVKFAAGKITLDLNGITTSAAREVDLYPLLKWIKKGRDVILDVIYNRTYKNLTVSKLHKTEIWFMY